MQVIVGLLWKRVDEATVVAETLRELLQQHGVLSPAEIETMLAEGRRIQHKAALQAFLKGLDAYQRRLLERYVGPLQ